MRIRDTYGTSSSMNSIHARALGFVRVSDGHSSRGWLYPDLSHNTKSCICKCHTDWDNSVPVIKNTGHSILEKSPLNRPADNETKTALRIFSICVPAAVTEYKSLSYIFISIFIRKEYKVTTPLTPTIHSPQLNYNLYKQLNVMCKLL